MYLVINEDDVEYMADGSSDVNTTVVDSLNQVREAVEDLRSASESNELGSIYLVLQVVRVVNDVSIRQKVASKFRGDLPVVDHTDDDFAASVKEIRAAAAHKKKKAR